MATQQMEDRIERQRRVELSVKENRVVDEEALTEVFRAAGAKSVEPEARKALRALAEREVARIAVRAAEEARARRRESVDTESLALAAARRATALPDDER